MGRLLDIDDPPTAVFAMSDEMALGAMAEVARRGLEVPTDVAVMGFDDHDLSEVVGLTTIRQSVDKLGEEAARMLLGHVDEPDTDPVAREWSVELVVRSSTVGSRAPR